jgi:hypothetical protein
VYDEGLISDRADYVAWWKDRLEERGIRMVVLLVPDKLSVYGPSLGVKLPDEPYLNRMERQLQNRGLKVVNGLPLLRAYAESDLQSGHLSYMREDHHWSVLGVERLAKATAESIRSSQDTRVAPALSRAH